MDDKWHNIGRLQYVDGGIISKEIFKGGKIDATLFCMAKGTKLSEHATPRDGVIFVLEGKGIFNLEGAEMPFHPGVVIRLKKKAVHSIRAEDNTSFLLHLAG